MLEDESASFTGRRRDLAVEAALWILTLGRGAGTSESLEMTITSGPATDAAERATAICSGFILARRSGLAGEGDGDRDTLRGEGGGALGGFRGDVCSSDLRGDFFRRARAMSRSKEDVEVVECLRVRVGIGGDPPKRSSRDIGNGPGVSIGLGGEGSSSSSIAGRGLVLDFNLG
jgi:hypothetical protein